MRLSLKHLSGSRWSTAKTHTYDGASTCHHEAANESGPLPTSYHIARIVPCYNGRCTTYHMYVYAIHVHPHELKVTLQRRYCFPCSMTRPYHPASEYIQLGVSWWENSFVTLIYTLCMRITCCITLWSTKTKTIPQDIHSRPLSSVIVRTRGRSVIAHIIIITAARLKKHTLEFRCKSRHFAWHAMPCDECRNIFLTTTGVIFWATYQSYLFLNATKHSSRLKLL